MYDFLLRTKSFLELLHEMYPQSDPTLRIDETEGKLCLYLYEADSTVPPIYFEPDDLKKPIAEIARAIEHLQPLWGQDSTISAEQVLRIEQREALMLIHPAVDLGGAEIRYARKAAGLSRVELAKRLSVPVLDLILWETDERIPTLDLQLAISKILTELIEAALRTK